MNFHATQKFGVSSLIDQLTKINNQILHLRAGDNSFTFQHIPEQPVQMQMKINKNPYLQNQIYDEVIQQISQQQKEQSESEKENSIVLGGVQFFSDLDDFHSRKEQISNFQRKYLSVISNNSQHRNHKMKIFQSNQRVVENISQQKMSVSLKKQQNMDGKLNWLQQKKKMFKTVIDQVHGAMVQCYAHIPKKQNILESFEKIVKNS